MKYGHIRDHARDVEEDLKHRHIGGLLGASASALVDGLDYSALLPSVPDQGSTSSCVGHAFATSLYLRARIAGHPIPRPSAKAIYDVARLEDGPRLSLTDEGSRPAVAMRGMMTYGVVAEDRWPLSDENVNEPPPLDVFENGLSAMVSAYYRIASGHGAAELARQALAKGFCPAFAMDVDADYEGLASDATYDGPRGPILGGHMQCLTGYGPGYFIVAGSWGVSFSRGGFARITDAFLERGASDLLVPTIVPTGLS